jgi:hypothetical protein
LFQSKCIGNKAHIFLFATSIKREDLEKLFPSFKQAGNKHKSIDSAVNAILKNNFIEMRKDEGNFKKQVLIENIEYFV